MNKAFFGFVAVLSVLGSVSVAQAANLPNQCYMDAMGYANNKVAALSANIVSVSRLGEEAGTEARDVDGMAEVDVALQAVYSNGAVAEYLVSVPVQLDDEGQCAVAGQATIRRLR